MEIVFDKDHCGDAEVVIGRCKTMTGLVWTACIVAGVGFVMSLTRIDWWAAPSDTSGQ